MNSYELDTKSRKYEENGYMHGVDLLTTNRASFVSYKKQVQSQKCSFKTTLFYIICDFDADEDFKDNNDLKNVFGC
jgi:hypothetical protein